GLMSMSWLVALSRFGLKGTPTSPRYPLSLHDALPIFVIACREGGAGGQQGSDSETLHNSLRENIAVAAASGSSTHKASVATSNSGGRVSDSATPAMPARLLTPADPARLNIR